MAKEEEQKKVRKNNQVATYDGWAVVKRKKRKLQLRGERESA